MKSLTWCWCLDTRCSLPPQLIPVFQLNIFCFVVLIVVLPLAENYRMNKIIVKLCILHWLLLFCNVMYCALIVAVSLEGDATAFFFSEHKDIFGTKNTLQLKIREVRQKMMGIQHATEEINHAEHKPSSPKPTSSHENRTPHLSSSEHNNSRSSSVPAVNSEAKHWNG